jgi:hypothetical protein
LSKDLFIATNPVDGIKAPVSKEDPASRITYLSEEEWKRSLIYDSNHWN